MALTTGRIILAPVFFLLYMLAIHGSPFLLIAVCLVFALIEVSDLLDGHAARALNQESEIGKVLDPFADSLSRLTYFVAFAGSGILPLWILLILVYRDVTVAYIRVMVSRGKSAPAGANERKSQGLGVRFRGYRGDRRVLP